MQKTAPGADLNQLTDAWLTAQQKREARRLQMGAMALGAAFAPGIWLCHAVLVHLHLI